MTTPKTKEISYNEVSKFLGKCQEHIIRYIELQLAFAKDVRAYQLEYSVSNKEFAQEFGITTAKVKRLRKGAVDITVKDMATLRTLYAHRIAQNNEMLKINHPI